MYKSNDKTSQELIKEKQMDSIKQVEVDLSNNTDGGDSGSLKTQKRSVLVLINPHSGRGKSVSIYKKKLLPILNTSGIDHQVFITETESRVHNYLYNKNIVDIVNLKSIIVVSGDGLFYETVNALMSRPDWKQAITVPIGVVPTGSGNGLAYTLFWQSYPDLKSRHEVLDICCQQAIQDETSLTDLTKITYGTKTIWSFLSLGWGLLSDIDIDSEWLRRLGEVRFTIYGLLRSLTYVSYRGRLSFKVAFPQTFGTNGDGEVVKFHLANESNTTFEMYNDKKSISKQSYSQLETNVPKDKDNDENWIHIEDRFSCLYAVYQTHISRHQKFSPNSTLTDQLIFLTYIRGQLNPFNVIKFLLAIKDGSHDKLPFVTVVPVSTFKFQPLEHSKIVVDGELIPWNLSDGPITASIVSKVLKLSWKS